MKTTRDGNSLQASEINEIRKLIVNKNIKDLLEIGTYRGNVVFSLYNLIVEEHEGSIVSVDIKSNDYNKQNKLNVEEHNMKEVYLSIEGSTKFFGKNNKMFDMIILDGDLSYDQLKKDLENSFDVLSENGIVLINGYRGSASVQRVVNETDGGAYNKVLIHTVHNLMTLSKKEIVQPFLKLKKPRVGEENWMTKPKKEEVPVSHKLEISHTKKEDTMDSIEVVVDERKEETRIDDGLVRSGHNRAE